MHIWLGASRSRKVAPESRWMHLLSLSDVQPVEFDEFCCQVGYPAITVRKSVREGIHPGSNPGGASKIP